ncbi:MAG: molybdopterin converting factor subunit 1 [Halobacteriovorax sp.]|nr:molybdopterin converting factor subunit 1 [Halobacteriovorax sp.]|tara:strand:- start:25806 stop:26045 length:240 start_codon:yes stop_codon:yes gene_type:complete
MKLKIKYFAAMREKAGVSEEILETNCKDALELLNELDKKYNFNLDRDHLKVAINEEYSSFDSSLKENDTLVFIPPVAGG